MDIKALYCPDCKRKVNPPSFLKKANILGSVTIACPHHNQTVDGTGKYIHERCKGEIVIEGTKKKEEVPANV